MGNNLQDIQLEGYTPLEVVLNAPDDFLKIRETLQRIGVASRKHINNPTLFQSCHILHKSGLYFLVHFKEMFHLDGKFCDLSLNDVQRRNTIAGLLEDWKLLKIITPEIFKDKAPLSQIKVLSFTEKQHWNLVAKYTIGNGNIERFN